MTIVTDRRRRRDDLQALLDGGRGQLARRGRGLADLVARRHRRCRRRPPADDAFRGRVCATGWSPRRPRGCPHPVVPAARARAERPVRLRQAAARPWPWPPSCAGRRRGRGQHPGAARRHAVRPEAPARGRPARPRPGRLGHGRELLEQADARLTEAEPADRRRGQQRPGDPAPASGRPCAEMAADVTAGAADLTEAYQETGDGQADASCSTASSSTSASGSRTCCACSTRACGRSPGRWPTSSAELDAQATAVTGGAALPATALTADGDGLGRRAAGRTRPGPRRPGGAAAAVGRRPGRGRRGHRRHRRRRHRRRQRGAGGSTGSRSGGGVVGGVVGSLTGGSRPARVSDASAAAAVGSPDGVASHRCRPAARWSPTRWVP